MPADDKSVWKAQSAESMMTIRRTLARAQVSVAVNDEILTEVNKIQRCAYELGYQDAILVKGVIDAL